MHDALPRDAARPNHLLMRTWSFAVFARKPSLQAFRQKRRPQWLCETRPNFPPQFAQRFSNLAMKLSADLEVDATMRQTRAMAARPCPRSAQPSMRLPPPGPALRRQFFAILGQRIVICRSSVARPELQMVKRGRAPTRNLFLTADGVATRLAIRELKKAKIDPAPLLSKAGISLPKIGEEPKRVGAESQKRLRGHAGKARQDVEHPAGDGRE